MYRLPGATPSYEDEFPWEPFPVWSDRSPHRGDCNVEISMFHKSLSRQSKLHDGAIDWLVKSPISPLRDEFSIGHIKMNLRFDIISPPWYDIGIWNTFSCKTSTYLFHIVNTTGADILVTQGARALATTLLTFLNRNNLGPRTIT